MIQGKRLSRLKQGAAFSRDPLAVRRCLRTGGKGCFLGRLRQKKAVAYPENSMAVDARRLAGFRRSLPFRKRRGADVEGPS